MHGLKTPQVSVSEVENVKILAGTVGYRGCHRGHTSSACNPWYYLHGADDVCSVDDWSRDCRITDDISRLD